MAKEATLQVRMDADLKRQVEELYKKLGTSFAEAVRIFAKQSIAEEGLPFTPRLNAPHLTEYVRKLPEAGYVNESGDYVLPADWNNPEDDIYEQLV